MSTAQAALPRQAAAPRRATFLHAVAFVGGFSVVFVILGASLGIVGSALQDNIIWFQRVAGVALIVLGLHLAEIITIPLLMRTYQVGMDQPTRPGAAPRRGIRRYGRSVFVGSAFSLGWTPCVGPILAGILTLAADSASVAQGTLLLVSYAVGIGVPFLIAGAAVGSSTAVLRKLGPWMPYISIAAGILLVFVGVLIFLDRVTVLNEFFGFAEGESTSGAGLTGTFGFALAFLAGILSFVSPCVLPLVPIYLSHLAGVSAEEMAAAGPGPPSTAAAQVEDAGAPPAAARPIDSG